MKKIISTLLLSFVVLTAFSQWYWVNPTPIGANLSDIAFTDDKTGYIVGQAGTILKTTDRGETWEYLSTGKLLNYTMIRFTDEQTGYVAGGGGFLMKTTDAGETWTRLETGITKTASDMYWIDNNTGFLCGANIRELLKTNDGGQTWYNVYPDLVFYGGYVNSVHFPTPLIGYASGSIGTVLKTVDGGETWTATTSEPMLDLRDIFFVNADTGFVAGEQGYFAWTFNGGANWDYTNDFSITGKHLYFTDHLNGYAIDGNNFMKTTDGGVTWTAVGMSEIGSYVFVTPEVVIGVGYHGRLFKSEDSGVTSVNYTSSVTEASFVDVHFPEASIGYAITDLPGQVLKTTDAGKTWEIVNSGNFDRLYSVWFTDANTGFLTNGVWLYKTIDGGYNWTVAGTQWNGYLQHIMFVNPQVGYITGESDGVLYRTNDGGDTWVELYRDEMKWPRNLYFLNENLGYLAMDHSIMKTTDGGQTFTEYVLPEENLFLSIHFPTETTGYVGSFYYGNVYKTTDAGLTWTMLPSDTTRFFPAVDLFFVNESIGYLSAGHIYQTNDGGLNWVPITYIQDGTARLWFTDELNGYIVGSDGDIFKTINAGAVPVINPVKPESIYTVYPNPTDGLVTIDNPAHKSGEPLQISIYNTTGTMVYTGQYTEPLIQFDLRDYPAGMYFIKIHNKEIKKVIIH